MGKSNLSLPREVEILVDELEDDFFDEDIKTMVAWNKKSGGTDEQFGETD